MKFNLKDILTGALITAMVLPFAVFAARTAAPVLTGLFPSTTLSVNLPSPVLSLGNSTTTGSVYSNGGAALYFQVTALDGVGETVGSQLLGTTTLNEAHGWQLTWSAIQGAIAYRVYFSTSTPMTMTQYFTATTTSSYSFTSTSTPTYAPNGPPSTTGAFAVNFSVSGNSWVNGGNIGVGTSSPAMLLDIASGTLRAYSLSTTTCAAVNDGAVFYNAKDKHLYVCESTVWQIIK